ncbi:MAG: S-adenosylmethionine decarboxylase [Burkholderiaceae bacterium]|jgi:S-adenosylmethionine decarboxylase|nr:S-adenosylmethionine decarboxylase [Burkholderiaceae bacterium]
MQGLHLTADLYQCACDMHWLTEAEPLLRACEQAVHAAGLRAVARLGHAFADAGGERAPDGGVTACVLLAESHVCVHTWPERRAVTLDVYVCNFSADHSRAAEQLLDALLALFQPAHAERHALRRGARSSA